MRITVAAVAACAVLAAACGVTTFERHLAAERWSDAAAAFAADTSLARNERTLYRAALLYATPALSTYDPIRARDLLARLLDRHPNSVHRESATRMIQLLDELESVREHHAARERMLEGERSRLEAEVEGLRGEIAGLERRMTQQGDSLRAEVDRLQNLMRERETQLRQLREELDRLKAIDLRARQRSGGG